MFKRLDEVSFIDLAGDEQAQEGGSSRGDLALTSEVHLDSALAHPNKLTRLGLGAIEAGDDVAEFVRGH